jgi:hypothetical protein
MGSVDRMSEHRFGFHGVPHAVVQWLLLIAATFVAGCIAIALLPSHQATVVNIGVWGNVAMAIGMGLVLAWKVLPQRLCCAAWLGAVVTVIGWDFLSFTVEEIHGQGGLGAIPFDVVALPVAGLGMLILLGAGAALGGIGRLLGSRCPCGRRLPRLGPFFP